MQKIVIKKHPLHDKFPDFFDQGYEIIQKLIAAIFAFQASTGIQIITKQKISLKEFIEIISSIIPFSDDRYLKLNSDQLKDAETFRDDFVFVKLYEIHDGRLGTGPRVVFDYFSKLSDTPELNELILCVINTNYEFKYWLHSLPKDVDLVPYFWIEDFQVHVAKDAQNQLLEKYTVYANEQQAYFFTEASNLLKALSHLEEKYCCPGLILKGIQSSNGYELNPETLTDLPS